MESSYKCEIEWRTLSSFYLLRKTKQELQTEKNTLMRLGQLKTLIFHLGWMEN